MVHSPVESAPDGKCPSCRKELAAKAVLCIECGFDLRTGQRRVTVRERAREERVSDAPSRPGKRRFARVGDSSPRFNDPTIDRSKLGSLEEAFTTDSKFHVFLIIGGVIVALVCGYFAYLFLTGTPPKGPSLEATAARIGAGFFVAFFGALTIAGLVIVVWCIRHWSWRIFLFENGFVIQKNRAAQAVFWDDVKYVYARELLKRGVVVGHAIQIDTDDGRRLKTGDGFTDVAQLIDAIFENCIPVLLAKAQRKLKNAEPVPFGSLQVVADGLEYGEHKLSWAKLIGPYIETRGRIDYLVIRKSGKRGDWYSCKLVRFPNIDTFMELVSGLAGAGRGQP